LFAAGQFLLLAAAASAVAAFELPARRITQSVLPTNCQDLMLESGKANQGSSAFGISFGYNEL
jgi:hypothetical protein